MSKLYISYFHEWHNKNKNLFFFFHLKRIRSFSLVRDSYSLWIVFTEYIGVFLVSRARNTNSLRRPVKLLLCIFDVKKLAKLKWHRDQDENQAEKKIELNIVLLVDETHMHSQFKNKCGQSLHIFVASFVCLQQ